MTNYNFSSKFKYANTFSISLFFISIILIAFKGLNYGIDFKGGTLIELRSNNTEASSIRDVLKNMELGDVNVKKFGKEGDFLIKVEQKEKNNKLIPKIKTLASTAIPTVNIIPAIPGNVSVASKIVSTPININKFAIKAVLAISPKILYL